MIIDLIYKYSDTRRALTFPYKIQYLSTNDPRYIYWHGKKCLQETEDIHEDSDTSLIKNYAITTSVPVSTNLFLSDNNWKWNKLHYH